MEHTDGEDDSDEDDEETGADNPNNSTTTTTKFGNSISRLKFVTPNTDRSKQCYLNRSPLSHQH